MMKILKNLIFGILLTSAHFTHAFDGYDHCDPCYDQSTCDFLCVDFCNMEFSLYADALYWHLHSTDLVLGDGSFDKLTPGNDWGWRAGGSARWNVWDLSLRYTSFRSKADKEAHFDQVPIVAKYAFDYRVFDAELGASCCICDGLLFRPFLGVKFANIDVTDDHVSELERDFTQELDGSGLYIGASSHWKLCSFNACGCCIPVAFVCRMSTGILDSDFTRTEPPIPPEKERRESKAFRFIPVHEVYAGLEFRMCVLCDADAFFQIGYEAQYWGWKGIAEDALSHAYLGVGGLVLRLGANF